MPLSLQQLHDIQAIKTLKARYFFSMDTKSWSELANCFTEDLHADFRDAPGMLVDGRDAYIKQLAEILGDSPTVHHGHTPQIELIDADHAEGIWAMDDIVELPDLSLRGWGHYYEKYRRVNGEWKIASIRLTRLRLLVNGEEQPVQRPSSSGD